MKRNIGETVYKYTLRKGEFFIHEGVIMKGGFLDLVYVHFKDNDRKERLPNDSHFGVVDKKGPSLWLADRDDKLARQLFIVYEENNIAELQKMINKKTQLIEDLKSGVA